MPLTPSFDAAQTINAQDFTLIDTSTGADAAIANRRIFLQLEDGIYLKPATNTTDYILFPLSNGASINIQGLLTKDYAISITINWVNSANTTLYTLTKTYVFTENDEQFDYSLTQYLAANIGLLQDMSYVFNRLKLRMFIDGALNAVETGNDISSSQQLLDFAQEMIMNEQNDF